MSDFNRLTDEEIWSMDAFALADEVERSMNDFEYVPASTHLDECIDDLRELYDSTDDLEYKYFADYLDLILAKIEQAGSPIN